MKYPKCPRCGYTLKSILQVYPTELWCYFGGENEGECIMPEDDRPDCEFYRCPRCFEELPDDIGEEARNLIGEEEARGIL